jgi:hypothetical protein
VEAKEGGGGEQEEEKEGKCDNNIIQSVKCGEGGRDDMTKAREWIATKMVAVTLKEFAVCVGLADGADGDIKDGVEFDEEGHITKIDWKEKNLNGNLDHFKDLARRMPRLQALDLSDNFALKGDLAQWHLPVGMKDLNLGSTAVTGKATSELKATSQILKYGFILPVQPHALLHSSFSPPSIHPSFITLLSPSVPLPQGISPSGTFPWACRNCTSVRRG